MQKPSQYQIGIDTIKRAEANLEINECIAIAKFNIDKYTWRNKGQDQEDMDKVIVYAKWMKKLLSKQKMIDEQLNI